MARIGPVKVFPSGMYERTPVEVVMKTDIRYFMRAVKDWLDVSPSQASLFKQLTKGGEIPPQFIKSPLGEKKLTKEEEWVVPKDWTDEDIRVVRDTWSTIPNYDFDPELAPPWWQECKERMAKTTRPSIRRKIYQEYLTKEVNEYCNRT